jgi:hypothetical protein
MIISDVEKIGAVARLTCWDLLGHQRIDLRGQMAIGSHCICVRSRCGRIRRRENRCCRGGMYEVLGNQGTVRPDVRTVVRKHSNQPSTIQKSSHNLRVARTPRWMQSQPLGTHLGVYYRRCARDSRWREGKFDRWREERERDAISWSRKTLSKTIGL